MASESSPPPPAAGGARYAIAGVALAAVAVLGYCLITPSAPPPPTSTTVAGPADAGAITRSTALVEDDLVIPADEPDTGVVDAGETHEVTHRTGPRPPSLGEWASCTGEMNARPVFEEYQSQFRACYEHRLKANPLLQGQMQLQVRVVADGHVEGVQVGGSLNDREVFTCVRNLANRMRFPHVTGGSCAVVAVPYTFTPQQ
jgi:hypothetical protein